MADQEAIEKIRQGIMRYRELLDIMRLRLDAAEKNYEALFEKYLPSDTTETEVKKLQWLIAEAILDDPTDLTKAISRSRFAVRDLEKAFEELFNHLTPD